MGSVSVETENQIGPARGGERDGGDAGPASRGDGRHGVLARSSRQVTELYSAFLHP